MGIIQKISISAKNMWLGWKKASTLEKVDIICDVLCGSGCGIAGLIASKKLTQGEGPVTKTCVRVAMTGLSFAAGDISSKAIRESGYTEVIANAIHRAKGEAPETHAKPKESKVTVNE